MVPQSIHEGMFVISPHNVIHPTIYFASKQGTKYRVPIRQTASGQNFSEKGNTPTPTPAPLHIFFVVPVFEYFPMLCEFIPKPFGDFHIQPTLAKS